MLTTGGLDDRPARLDEAISLCVLDHAQANAVLDAAAGVEVLTLGQQFTLQTVVFGDVVQANERRVADLFQNGVVYLRPRATRLVFVRIGRALSRG